MATKFSIKDPNPGVWFKFDEDDPDSGEIRIRALNETKRREIQKTCTKQREIYKHGQRYTTRDTNDDLFSEMLWDYSIAEWSKLEDDDGKPLDCDTETKLFLMQNNVGFAKFVSVCMEKLADEELTRVAIIEKNSLSGLSGSKKNQTAKPAKN